MQIGLVAIAAAAVLSTNAHAEEATPPSDHWYARIEDGRWCSYATEKDWNANPAHEAASASFLNGQLRHVTTDTSDESGDWIEYDDYTVENGLLTSLKRTYNTFYNGEISLRETYTLRDGQWRRLTRNIYALGGDDPRPDQPDVKPPDKPVNQLSAFGFYAVLNIKPAAKPICK